MEHRLVFYPKNHLVVLYTHGMATTDGLRALVTDLLAHPNWVPGMTILADHRELNFHALSAADVEIFRHFIKTKKDSIGPARVATIVKDPSSYGMTRMWEIPLEDEVRFDHRVFYIGNDAKAWLGLSIDDEPLL